MKPDGNVSLFNHPVSSLALFFVVTVWIKLGETINDNRFLSMGGKRFDISVDPKKFSFTKNDSRYTMNIRRIELEDAGMYLIFK